MTTTEYRTRHDVEAIVGVESIEALHAERREIVARLAPLRALYGPGGTWDARRKAFRSAVANEIALALAMENAGKKPSEAELERLAAADPRVVAKLETAEAEMALYHVLTNDVQALDELVMRDQAVLRFACTEPRA